MLNSALYHRQCKLREYSLSMHAIEKTMRNFRDDTAVQQNWLKSHRLILCKYCNCDNNTFLTTLNQMTHDYFDKKCRYCNDSTLFDICLRKNINRFKAVFSSPGTHSILQSFYEYASKSVHYITIKNKKLVDMPLDANCYFRHYINLFFCYDMATSLLENYKTVTDPEQMTFIEIIVDDIIYLLNTILCVKQDITTGN